CPLLLYIRSDGAAGNFSFLFFLSFFFCCICLPAPIWSPGRGRRRRMMFITMPHYITLPPFLSVSTGDERCAIRVEAVLY
ncbi:hypothetical protein F5X96DRAFT_629533, partial [Biscogniauxia mediterranea]